MHSYIVRVYRRSGQARNELMGVVEAVDDGRQWSFSERDELWNILLQLEEGKHKRKRK